MIRVRPPLVFWRLPALLFFATILPGCALLRIDEYHYLIRSPHITSPAEERAIVARANLGWTDDKKVRVLVVRGTPYERGYQQGVLLRKEVRENLGYLYDNALKTFRSEELFAEAYERLRPFIPQEYVDEMHGLAHGSRLPLHVIHYIHALPELTEWGGKKRIKAIVKQMMAGDLGTSCSNIAATKSATADHAPYTVRILDWGLHKISKLHEYPLITISVPDEGLISANIGWVGFLGAISGMNEAGITLGEMGYGDPEYETLAGIPMPFLLRDVLSKSRGLTDVRPLIEHAPGTSSFIFVMSDGKTNEAEMYVKDSRRFRAFRPGADISDGSEVLRPIPDVLYGGHSNDRMNELLTARHGSITPEFLMKEVVPQIAMKSNFQNVIYDPSRLRFWVNFARSNKERAAEQPYTFFDLGKHLAYVGRNPSAH